MKAPVEGLAPIYCYQALALARRLGEHKVLNAVLYLTCCRRLLAHFAPSGLAQLNNPVPPYSLTSKAWLHVFLWTVRTTSSIASPPGSSSIGACWKKPRIGTIHSSNG